MGDNSEMTKKTSLDFDFSDIAGKTTQVESVEAVKDILQDPEASKDLKKTESEKPKEKPKAKEKEKDTGYSIAVPADGNKWLDRDIASCTPDEFIRWAKHYYPVVTATPERFRSIGNRMRAFQTIVSWHLSMLPRAIRETIH